LVEKAQETQRVFHSRRF